MARKRMIDPEFWSDEKIAAISPLARLTFIGMWSMADDEGLLRFNATYIKSSIFIYDDQITISQVEHFMEEIVNQGLVFPYQGTLASQRYAYIINFRKHQTINRPQPSKLPPPSIQNKKCFDMYRTRDNDVCWLCLEPVDVLDTPNRPNTKSPSLDHVIARSSGGSDYPSNIKIAHLSCNKSKGTLVVNDSMNDSRPREEKRREVNIKEDKIVNSISYLRNIPEEDLREFTFRFDASEYQIKSKAEDLENYCMAKSKKYSNYKAFLLNALKKDFKELTEKQRKERELNQPRIQATIKKMAEKHVDSDVGTPEVADDEKFKALQEKRKQLLNSFKT